MALQLFRLASESFPSISAVTSQTANAYFHVMSTTVPTTAAVNYTIGVTTWVLEDGTAAANFATGQGLSMMCINGVLQQSGLYTIAGGANTRFELIPPAGGITLTSGYVITLQTYNAAAAVTYTAPATTLIAIP